MLKLLTLKFLVKSLNEACNYVDIKLPGLPQNLEYNDTVVFEEPSSPSASRGPNLLQAILEAMDPNEVFSSNEDVPLSGNNCDNNGSESSNKEWDA